MPDAKKTPAAASLQRPGFFLTSAASVAAPRGMRQDGAKGAKKSAGGVDRPVRAACSWNSGRQAAVESLTAQTLNSGIPEMGSRAALVSLLAAASA